MRDNRGDERGRSAPLIGLYGGVTLFAVGEQALHVVVPPYLSQVHGLGEAAIGLVVAVFGLAALTMRLPVGALFRYRRTVPLLLVGGGMVTMAFALVPFVASAGAFGALMAVDGMGWALVTSTQLTSLVGARSSRMPLTVAMAWFSGAQGVGNTIGGVTGGFLADQLGFRGAFLVLAAIPALATVLTVAGFVLLGSITPSVTVAPGSEKHDRPARALAVLKAMPAVVWGAVLLMFYINFVNGFVNTFHPILALAAGLTLTQIGGLASCRSLASSVVRIGSGVIFWKTRRRLNLTMPLALLSAAAMFAIPSVRSSFLWQVPLFALIGLSRGLIRITGSSDAFGGVEQDERQHGFTSALLNAGLDAGKVAGPVLGGMVAAGVGIAAAFRVVPLVLVGVYLALMLLSRRARLVANP
ncbi:MAG TPA: MFS transporter [Acidimicrobiia bacterium]|nr:MFS transporter [Acidimicrobiia bacterium]